jgi:peroxiredoxin/outer membrane lipoprotein-sorting protein
MKLFISTLLVLSVMGAKAQVSLVQQAIDKLESYQNFSYQSVYRQKEYTNDTLVMEHRDVFLKAPNDSALGYLFRLETLNGGNKFPDIVLYNGQSLIGMNPEDSTYNIGTIKPYTLVSSLPGYLKQINHLIKTKPSRVIGDTLINGVVCTHLEVNTYDTVINNEHYYTRIHLFFDRMSGLPDLIMAKSRSARNGDGITNYYSTYEYADYKFNDDKVDVASMAVPAGYHPPKAGVAAPDLLAPGTVAPDWVLYSADGRKMSLAQLKGKVVLLDFFFIGCEGCMRALTPLNKLHEKYKNRNVAIVSMTHRDSQSSVKEFSKNYHIKYPVYINAGEVVKTYHVSAFPTFYFIDRTGKIARFIIGYDDDFEEKVSAFMDELLK